MDTADFATRRNIIEQIVKRVVIGKSDITIEYIAPCEKKQLRNNLEHGISNNEGNKEKKIAIIINEVHLVNESIFELK